MSIYEELEDKEIIFKVNATFYEKVYEHPWMKLFFEDIDQEFITDQQTQFIRGAVGGPNTYSGRMPSNAHPHMFITEEIFDLRKQMLVDALSEEKAPQNLVDAWLKIDESFRGVICKKEVSECEKRYNSDSILVFEKPNQKKAA